MDNKRSRTDVMSEVIFLGKLVERIVAGKIRVPRFQRTFVWKQGDLHKLLESILRGFPIGSILVWDTAEEIASTERIGPVKIGSPPDGSVGYLLDGQQRVSTLGSGSSIWRLLPSLSRPIRWPERPRARVSPLS